MSDKEQPKKTKPQPQQLTPEEQREQRESRRERAQLAARFLSNMDRINELEEELRRCRRFHVDLLSKWSFLGNVLGEVNRLPPKKRKTPSDTEMTEASSSSKKPRTDEKKERRQGRAGLEKTLAKLEGRVRGVEKDEMDYQRRMQDK